MQSMIMSRGSDIMLYLLSLLCLVSVSVQSSDQEVMPSYLGKMCAFVDMNYDTFTDILVLSDAHTVTVLLAPADTLKNEAKFTAHHDWNITVSDKEIIGCATGDVDGDSFVDVIVTYGEEKNEVTVPQRMAVFFGSAARDFKNSFELDVDILNFASVIDFNLDGLADIVVQTGKHEFSCFASAGEDTKKLTLQPADKCFSMDKTALKALNYTIDSSFAHAYTYLDNKDNLQPSMLIGYTNGTNRTVLEWHSRQVAEWIVSERQIPLPPPSTVMKPTRSLYESVKHVFVGESFNAMLGLMAVSDFDADGETDLILPETAGPGNLLLHVWHSHKGIRVWSNVYVDLQSSTSEGTVHGNQYGTFSLGVGDADSDGYPDLLLMLDRDATRGSYVAQNLQCKADENCGALGRKFVINWQRMKDVERPEAVQLTQTAFFDMFEDGVLDLVMQFADNKQPQVSHVQLQRALDARDTTFVKAQVYTRTCTYKCANEKNKEGSVVSYAGATVLYTVETEDGAMKGVLTQQSQQGHSIMQLPFVLFGLGRNPNFVELLRVNAPSPQSQLLSHDWPQIVPNSRMYIVPPSKEYNGWIGRLYVTPSRLVLLSFATLCALCGCVLLMIVFLWWRERVHDHKDREAQSHKFNFAM